MKIQLSDHFNYRKILQFAFPSIVMMVFTSIYGVVDGLFVSNFVGKTSFAAVNLIMPLLMIIGTLGFMLGTGGNAIVSKTLGMKEPEKANQYFSLFVYTTVIGGIILSIIGQIFLKQIAMLLGAEGEILNYCIIYGRITLLTLPSFMLQNIFQSFLVTAEKPHLGLAITVSAGVTNMVLDFLFIAVFRWGVAGAAAATGISELVGGITPFIYFIKKNSSLLQLTKTKIELKILLKACTNGSSELMTNISMSLVNMLYNFQLIKLAGENGIAAYGVIMYVNFIFVSIFIGYAIGISPVIGYHYGAADYDELKLLFGHSLKIVGVFGIVLVILAQTLSAPLTQIFVGYDKKLFEMTSHGFKIYGFAFLISGFNIFGSAFFTALGNGIISACISFLRTLVFQVACVLILPIFFGINGIWTAIVAAEIFALIITVIFFIANSKKYHYV